MVKQLHLDGLFLLLLALNSYLPPTVAQQLPPIAPPPTSPPVIPPFLEPSAPLQVEPQPAPAPELHGEQTILLKRIVFRGNRALSSDELMLVAAPFLGKLIQLQDLFQLREAISRYYAQRGYTLSSAVIPIAENQHIKPDDAEIVVQCLEGTVDTLSIGGNQRLADFIRYQLKSALEPAINEPRLINALNALKNNPAIRDIKAHIGSFGGLCCINREETRLSPDRGKQLRLKGIAIRLSNLNHAIKGNTLNE